MGAVAGAYIVDVELIFLKYSKKKLDFINVYAHTIKKIKYLSWLYCTCCELIYFILSLMRDQNLYH